MKYRTIVIRERNGIDGSEEEVPITIDYTRHRAYIGTTDGRYGPKLEPDEPAYIEIDGAEDEHGNEIELTDAEINDLEKEIEDGRSDAPSQD